MAPDGLAKLLSIERKTTRLVVHNACYSNEMATQLINDIDCVIGMTSEVDDHTPALFSRSLYGALFDGLSVADAFETAKGAVMARYPAEGEQPILRTRSRVEPAAVRIV